MKRKCVQQDIYSVDWCLQLIYYYKQHNLLLLVVVV